MKVHYIKGYHSDYRGIGLCGKKTDNHSQHSDQVTCLNCKKKLA